MKAILLDGSLVCDTASERISTAIIQNLENGGYEVEVIPLRDKTIGNCAGDFFCWIKNPGICNVKDDNLAIAESFMHSDLAVYLTLVTFGGYSSTLKKFVDHQIQNISPYFAQVEGETHHQKRYDKYPDLMVVGYADVQDQPSDSVFRQLVHRNSINFYAEHTVCEVIHADQSDEQVKSSIQNCLEVLHSGKSVKSIPAQIGTSHPLPPMNIKRAVLLVGSPRTRKSTSNSLGEYLFNRLAENNIQTDVIHLHTITHSKEKTEAMLELIDHADLVALAFPLYVDSLPAPVIAALETIATHRKNTQMEHPQLFAAIANCGFPESHHNTTALAICEVFANQTGFIWAGSLSLGGGGIVDGGAIATLGGRVTFIKKSLDLAAVSLIKGEAIPEQAKLLMAKPMIPAWLYRFMGSLGWIALAKKFGVLTQLRRKPYQTKPALKEF